MTVKLRHYTDEPGFTDDFFKVRDFLMRIHEPGYTDENWLWVRWEYMFSHPNLDESNLSRIGLWEDDGKIVGMTNYESVLGEAYFSLDRSYSFLKTEMLEYAQEHLSTVEEDETRTLSAILNDNDEEMRALAKECGFAPTEHTDPMSEFRVISDVPKAVLPEGFSILSLDQENDLKKIDRALWRGFNHPGKPPEDGLTGRRKMQSGPHFRKDLTLCAKAPNGDYACFCGLWYDRATDYAMVEPLATDPDYRRLGLGKALVLEGIRRCAHEGAVVAYVGSQQQFYLSTGFRLLYKAHYWEWSSK